MRVILMAGSEGEDQLFRGQLGHPTAPRAIARYTLRPCAGSSSPITKWPCSNFEGAALHPLGVRRRKMTPDQKAQGLGRRDFLKTVAGATAAAAALLPQAG